MSAKNEVNLKLKNFFLNLVPGGLSDISICIIFALSRMGSSPGTDENNVEIGFLIVATHDGCELVGCMKMAIASQVAQYGIDSEARFLATVQRGESAEKVFKAGN